MGKTQSPVVETSVCEPEPQFTPAAPETVQPYGNAAAAEALAQVSPEPSIFDEAAQCEASGGVVRNGECHDPALMGPPPTCEMEPLDPERFLSEDVYYGLHPRERPTEIRGLRPGEEDERHPLDKIRQDCPNQGMLHNLAWVISGFQGRGYQDARRKADGMKSLDGALSGTNGILKDQAAMKQAAVPVSDRDPAVEYQGAGR